MGTGVERTRVAVVGPRLAECGTNGGVWDKWRSVGQMAQAVRALADPAAPHLHR